MDGLNGIRDGVDPRKLEPRKERTKGMLNFSHEEAGIRHARATGRAEAGAPSIQRARVSGAPAGAWVLARAGGTPCGHKDKPGTRRGTAWCSRGSPCRARPSPGARPSRPAAGRGRARAGWTGRGAWVWPRRIAIREGRQASRGERPAPSGCLDCRRPWPRHRQEVGPPPDMSDWGCTVKTTACHRARSGGQARKGGDS
jgi:hypothetical protein